MMRAIVRPPSPALADGLVTHIDRSPVDTSAAVAQWHGYVDAMRSNGWEIIHAPAADDCPDGVFVEDAAVVFDDIAVITRPGATSRQAEVDTMRPVLANTGLAVVDLEHGSLDGGDVMKVGRTAYVGLGGRTDAQGLAALAAVIEPAGWTVVAVPISKVLHLKSAVTALPDGTVVGWPPALDDPTVFPTFLVMPEEGGAHVVDLGEGRLLIAADTPLSQRVLAQRGFTPVPVDISEFVKLEGCVTCLSVRVRSVSDRR
jgi:dimethylargininase